MTQIGCALVPPRGRPEAAHAEAAIAHAFGGGQLCKTSITRRGLLLAVFLAVFRSL
jgi:hypothetical protein